jgi:hypothetical protein
MFARSHVLRHVDEEVRDEFLRVFKARKNVTLHLETAPVRTYYKYFSHTILGRSRISKRYIYSSLH